MSDILNGHRPLLMYCPDSAVHYSLMISIPSTYIPLVYHLCTLRTLSVYVRTSCTYIMYILTLRILSVYFLCAIL